MSNAHVKKNLKNFRPSLSAAERVNTHAQNGIIYLFLFRTLFYSAHIHTIESSRRLADVLARS
jgi:hypothetical protein